MNNSRVVVHFDNGPKVSRAVLRDQAAAGPKAVISLVKLPSAKKALAAYGRQTSQKFRAIWRALSVLVVRANERAA
jgi:hypothetical protein